MLQEPSPALDRSPKPAATTGFINLTELKRRSPAELLEYAEELGIDSAEHAEEVRSGLRRCSSGWPRPTSRSTARACSRSCRTASASCARRTSTIVAGPDDIYVSPSPDPALRAAHRRRRPGPGPGAQGGRALFRPAAGQHDQFRHAGAGAPSGPFRQSDALLPDPEAQSRGRGLADQGRELPDHRDRGAARQGPARADRRPAAHRQDDADAEHRPQRSWPITPRCS